MSKYPLPKIAYRYLFNRLAEYWSNCSVVELLRRCGLGKSGLPDSLKEIILNLQKDGVLRADVIKSESGELEDVFLRKQSYSWRKALADVLEEIPTSPSVYNALGSDIGLTFLEEIGAYTSDPRTQWLCRECQHIFEYRVSVFLSLKGCLNCKEEARQARVEAARRKKESKQPPPPAQGWASDRERLEETLKQQDESELERVFQKSTGQPSYGFYEQCYELNKQSTSLFHACLCFECQTSRVTGHKYDRLIFAEDLFDLPEQMPVTRYELRLLKGHIYGRHRGNRAGATSYHIARSGSGRP